MLEPIAVTRVVTTPEALAALDLPLEAVVLATTADEAIVIGAHPDDISLSDPHAIVISDPGWMAVWLANDVADVILSRGAEWRPDDARPTLAQGMLMQLPVKMWVTQDRTLLMASHTIAADLGARIEAVL